MEDGVQLKAMVPRALKRQFYVRLLQHDEKFNAWLYEQIRTWLATHPAPKEEVSYGHDVEADHVSAS